MFIPQKTNDYSNVFTSVHQSASAAEAKLIAGQSTRSSGSSTCSPTSTPTGTGSF